MSSLDFDLDTQMHRLETQWRMACESSIVARTDYQILVAGTKAGAGLLEMARERMKRAEELKVRIMANIERLEADMFDRD